MHNFILDKAVTSTEIVGFFCIRPVLSLATRSSRTLNAYTRSYDFFWLILHALTELMLP
jgi:hypothetical protein